jgi:hypothetical protein
MPKLLTASGDRIVKAVRASLMNFSETTRHPFRMKRVLFRTGSPSIADRSRQIDRGTQQRIRLFGLILMRKSLPMKVSIALLFPVLQGRNRRPVALPPREQGGGSFSKTLS